MKSAPPAAYYAHKPISCNACRKRKLKCDRVKPCSSCVLRGIEHTCYQDEEPVAGPSGSSSATRVTTASPTGPAPPSPRGQTAVSYPPEGGEGLTARILKRPRSTSTQDDPATSSYDSDLRRENVERKLNPSLATALTGDAASLLLDVTQTLQREQRRLEEVLTAIQRGNASSESSTASTAFDGSGRRKSFEGGITLREHLSQLPAIETCERLFNFYFHELAPFTSHVSPSDVAEIWDHLTSGYAVVASQASRVVCALATSAMMLPALHPLQQLGISPAEVSAWVELAEQLFWQSHRESQIIGDRRFGSVKTYQDFSDNLKSLCMFTVLYTYSGQVDSLWDTIGHGVRRGSACGLFDRRHVSWQMLDDMEREQRIAMAKHLLVLDRWQAFVCARPFAIHPLQVHLTTARDGDPDNCPMSLQLRLTEAAYEFSDTIDAYPPSERHRRALDIEAVLEHGMRRGLVRYCSDGGTAIMSERGSLFPYIHAFAHSQRPVRMFELVWLSSFAFLRCMVTRRFLTDESVPASLRYRSLDHAKCVLATAPAISRILREGTAPLNVTLNGNHFLCALTAYIAAAAGGRDTYPESLGRALGEHPHELRTLASNHAHALSRITLGPEVGAARASDWRMERRLPPLLPAGMMPSSAPADGGVHVRPDLASSRGQSPSSSGVTVQGEHTYQQRDPSPLCQTRLPALEHRRPTEHIQWLRQNMSTVVECFKLLEERGSTKAERCQALLRLLLDIATSLGGGMSAAAGSGGVGGSHRPAASPSSSSESWAGDRTNHSETWSDRPSPGTHPYPPPPPPPPPPLPLSRPSSFGASQRLATSPLPMNDALRHHSGSRTNSTSSGAGAASAQEKANRRPSVAARVLMDAVLLDAPEVQGMAMCDVDYMTNLTQGYQRPQTQPQLPPSGDHHAAQQHYAPQHALSHQNVHAHAALTPKGQRQQHYYR